MPQHDEIEVELGRAHRSVSGRSAWVLTDGKAGDVAHCLGVAERLGLAVEQRVVHPRTLFAALMPHDVGLKSGPGATEAAFRVAGPQEVAAVLSALAMFREGDVHEQ